MPAIVSFILPVQDACDTVEEALERLLRADLGHPELRREIIVVDDASTDGTVAVLRHAAALGTARVCFHPERLGHGAALSTGLALATGDIIVVVDPTLAYDPAEAGRLLAPIIAGDADVVYGSRYIATTRQVPKLWERLSDQILTAVSNGLTNVALTDVTTTYQAFRADVVRGAILRAEGCGIAGELAALFTTRQCRIFEVPVTYHARQSPAASTRWFEGLSHLTMMARSRLRTWHLAPVAPHAPLRAPVLAAPRGARLTRLVHPIDMMPMMPTATRPFLRPN
jgi:glycosyltransferase involved in cell wall biosynthesis